MSFTEINYDVRDGVAIVTLNRDLMLSYVNNLGHSEVYDAQIRFEKAGHG